MPKPQRRRRFFALDGRLEVDDLGEVQGVAEPVETGADASARSTGGEAASADEDYRGTLAEGEDAALPSGFRPTRLRISAANRRHSSFWLLACSLGCLALGGVGGFLGARAFAPASQGNGRAGMERAVKPLASTDQGELDAAYAKLHTHEFAEAEALFVDLGRKHPKWPVVDIEIGRSLLYQNKIEAAGNTLRAAIDKGEMPAEANFLLGVIYNAQKVYPDAEECFAKAVSLDPSQAYYYFIWGNCLRSQGKLMDATAKFRAALLRNQYETAIGLFQAKLWLSQIDGVQADAAEVNAEIDSGLAQPLPAMEVLCAAAARSLKAGDSRRAVDYLVRARQRGDSLVFYFVLNDPVFDAVRLRPELAGVPSQ